MPSSDLQPPTHSAIYRRKWGGAVIGAIIGAVGLALVGIPLFTPEAGNTLLLVATGVAMLATAAAMEIGALWLPRPASAVTSEDEAGGTALRIRLRTQVPWSVALVGAGFTVFFVAIGLTTGGGGGLLVAPFVLLFASLVPDAVLTLLCRGSLRVDADGVRLDGWGVEAALAWGDVEEVDLATDVRRPSVQVHGVDGATSWQHRRRRIVWHTETRAARPTLTVPVAALDAPGAVMVLCRELASMSPQRRRAFLQHGARGLLTGDRSVG